MSVRNKQGLWINSSVFSEAARNFQTYGRYTDALVGTLEYDQFWDAETEKCLKGVTIGGASITGRHYFYLNYCPIKRMENNDEKTSKNKSARQSKKMDFPDFWDGDYNFFMFKDIADYGLGNDKMPFTEKELYLDYKVLDTDGGKFLGVTKRRRAGFSFKLGSIAAHKYTFFRNSLTLLCAYEKKYLYPSGIFSMSDYYLNFLNTHTDFGKQRLINKSAEGYIKSGFIRTVNDIEVIKGYQSEIMSLTFQNNPSAARGKSAEEIIVEEIGTFENWKETYYALEPCVREGDFVIGGMSCFGTGDTEDNIGIRDFEEMFYNPKQYNMLPFENVWDEDQFGTNCCFFFPAYQNYLGQAKNSKGELINTVDKQGNSNKELSKELLLKRREEIKSTAKSPIDYIKHTTEWPLSCAESFQLVSNNIFPVDELKKQLGFCKTRPEYKGKLGTLSKDEFGNINFNINLDAQPLEYQGKTTDKSGWIQIWENPISRPPWGLYVAGLDPYATDEADYSESLGSMFIFKRYLIGEETKDIIVAEYTGRPSSFKEYYDNCILLLEYYGVVGNCLYENNINNFKTHLENRHKLYLLSKTPSILKSASNQNVNSYGLRVVGNSYSSVKNELITYINQWLREEDEEGVSNVYKIKSIGLLQELIRYNNTGNFDRFISFALALVRHIELIKVPIKDTSYNSAQGKSFFSNKLFSN